MGSGPPGYWGPGPTGVDPYGGPSRAVRPTEDAPPRRDSQVRKRREPASQHLAYQAAEMLAAGDMEPLESLVRDKSAPTTRGPKDARRAFVEELVRRSTGRLYPLVPEGLRAAAACLKWGGTSPRRATSPS